MSCSLRQAFEMGVLQLEKVAFERVTESKQICIICKTQGRNTRRGGVDSFMLFRDVKQEKNRGERRALRNTTMNRNRRKFRVIKNKGSRVIGAEGVDSAGEPERYTFSFQDLLKRSPEELYHRLLKCPRKEGMQLYLSSKPVLLGM